MWNGQDQLRCCVHDGVEGVVAVQLEHAEVHVVAAQDGLQHEKADGNAFEAHLVDLIFGNVDGQDSVAVAADQLGSLTEQQITVGTRHVKHQPLRAVLHELAEELQHRRGDGWIVRPDLHGADQDRRVSRVNPVEEHHVWSFLVKAISQAADVPRESN